jgi:chromosome segregation ATPase
MNIPTIYILFAAELLLLLSVLCVFLFLYLRRLKNTSIKPVVTDNNSATVEISNTYIDYLDHELLKQNELSFNQELASNTEDSTTDTDDNDNSEDESNKSRLLDIRNNFLSLEKSAAELSNDEVAFWEKIYSGLQHITDGLTITKEVPVAAEQQEPTTEASEDLPPKENVFYIETQGEKINIEVNKLKDIISDQEHTLNYFKKTLEKNTESTSENTDSEDSGELQELKTQTENFSRQINDSKMCMGMLEMENERLQNEVRKLKKKYNKLFSEQNETQVEKAAELNENIDQMKNTLNKQDQQISELNDTIDKLELSAQSAQTLKDKLKEFAQNSKEMIACIAILEDENEFLSNMIRDLEQQVKQNTNPISLKSLRQMQDVLDKQERQISELIKTIGELHISTEQAKKLKSTITDFANSSREMMGCIILLEEKNDSLQNTISEFENSETDTDTKKELENLIATIKTHEKEIIKKDVAYAKLQDELTSIEKKYQTMYEQVHGEG